MGGKAAEDIEFGADNVTAGCVSDLQQASNIARKMVMQFGMAPATDPQAPHIVAPIYMNESDYAYLSDAAKSQVDAHVTQLLTEAYETAHSILTTQSKAFKNLSEALIEFETLGKEEIQLAIAGKRKEIKKLRDKESKARTEERARLASSPQKPVTGSVAKEPSSSPH
jgi:ATP-dependent Zn protease